MLIASKNRNSLMLFILLIFHGCAKAGDPNSIPSPATLTSPPSVFEEWPPEISHTDVTQDADAQSQVQYLNQNVALDFDGVKSEMPDAELKHLVTINPPEIRGMPLFPTDFGVLGNSLIISYASKNNQGYGGLQKIDLREPTNPKVISTLLKTNQGYSMMAIDGATLYLGGSKKIFTAGNTTATQKAVLNIFNFDRDNAFHPIGEFEFSGTVVKDILVEGARAHVAVLNDGVYTLDLSDPKEIKVLNKASLDAPIRILKLYNKILILSALPETKILELGLNTLVAVTPSFAASSLLTGDMQFISPYLYVNTGFSGLHIFNAKSLFAVENALALERTLPLEGIGSSLHLISNYGFLSQGSLGVQVFDFFNLDQPDYVGSLDFDLPLRGSHKLKSGFINKNNLIFIGEENEGVRILSIKPTLKISASKFYGSLPYRADGRIAAFHGSEVKIPQALPVTQGNAGNGEAVLSFDSKVSCKYRGGGSQGKSSKSSRQWNKGLWYFFDSCTNGLQAGDKISFLRYVTLNIINGNSNYSPTTIEVQLESPYY